jgi:hypothetical protein
MNNLIDLTVLSNFDITNICRELEIKLDSVMMNDQFNSKMLDYDFSIILNFQNYNQNGSHWAGMYCSPKIKTVYYMDSYGELPTARIYKIIIDRGYTLLYNKRQFQALESQLCGWYTIYFLYMMQKSRSQNKLKAMEKFLNLFTYEIRDLDNNDKKIKQLFVKLMKKKKV